MVVLFIDLDGFKVVNDTHGHAIGDRLLVEVARRLELVARRTDTVARLGGDEFVLLCESSGSSAYARLIAFRIVRALAAPYLLAQPAQVEGAPPLKVELTASVGVVATRDASATPERLLSSADAAMYEAKESGGNSYRFCLQLEKA